MNEVKRIVCIGKILFAAFIVAAVLGSAALFGAVRADAEADGGYAADITGTGADFITSVPVQTEVYKAGEGTVTYIPASADETAQIVLENAVLHSEKKVNYWSQNWTYSALAATGDVRLVLKGDNRVYLRSGSSSNDALMFYDSNVVVSGDGSLTIEHENVSEGKNSNVIPLHVRSDNDLSGDEEAYAGSGNFVMESGTISMNAGNAFGEGCLTVINDVKILGGDLRLYGQSRGIYSVEGDIGIAGGSVRAEEFKGYGLYASKGNVTIGGDAKVYVSSFKNSTTTGIVGRSNGAKGGNVYINGGETEVLVPNVGVLAQGGEATGAGRIEITDGKLNVTVSKGSAADVEAIFAQGTEADIVVSGGTVTAFAEGSGETLSFGMYADRNIEVRGGSLSSGAANTDKTGSSFGIGAAGSVSVTGGEAVVYGDTAAISCDAAPVFAEKMSVFAASDAEGKNESVYDGNELDSYKYLKFERTEILSVTVSPVSADAEKGKTLQFTAEVQGVGGYSASVVWKVSGANSANTKIDENGLLSVAADETAESIVVTAVSSDDPEKSASVTVSVLAASGDDTPENGGGLPGWAIALIAAGACLVAAAVAVSVYFIVKKFEK